MHGYPWSQFRSVYIPGSSNAYGTQSFGMNPNPMWTAAPYANPTYTYGELLSRIGDAVNGEYNAIRKYGRLAELAPTQDVKDILEMIQSQESMHLHHFSSIYAYLTRGRKAPITDALLPENFQGGIEESIQDELRDSRFYQDTSLYSGSRHIQWTLLAASHDEARHATWFSYLWMKTK